MGLPNGSATQTPDITLPGPKPWHSFISDHPIGFWFIFWGEFAERCSYYGMRAILVMYMGTQLGLGMANALTYMSLFMAACYLLPLVGGYVADNFLGKYRTIVLFSLPYILGHVILGVENYVCLVVALTLLAMGSGVIKPNISTLMGLTYDQQRPNKEQLRSNAFAIFYMAINIGAGISQIAMPLLRNEYGYWVAFLFPAGLMVLAFAIFAAGKPFYAREVISRTPATPEQRSLKLAILFRIGGLFLLVMVFWAVFDQSASTWIFFADTYMDANLLELLTVDAEQIQALNAWLIVLLVPVVTLLWNYLNRIGLRVRATDKMVVGFLLTAACMGVMSLSAYLAGPTQQEARLALKEGAVHVDQGRVVFAEGEVEVRNLQAKVKDGRITMKSGEVVIGNASPVKLSAAAFPAHRVHEREGGVEIKHGKFFIQGGSVLVQDIGKGEGGANVGTVTVQDGKAVAVTGNLTLTLTEGKVQGLEEAVILQPDVYTLSANKVGLWWQALAYLLVTLAEILISVTGLELAFVAAPHSLKGFVTGMWLLPVFLANAFINAPITRLYAGMPPSWYFAMLAGMALVAAVLFVFVAKRFNRITAEIAVAEKPPTTPGGSSTAIMEA